MSTSTKSLTYRNGLSVEKPLSNVLTYVGLLEARLRFSLFELKQLDKEIEYFYTYLDCNVDFLARKKEKFFETKNLIRHLYATLKVERLREEEREAAGFPLESIAPLVHALSNTQRKPDPLEELQKEVQNIFLPQMRDPDFEREFKSFVQSGKKRRRDDTNASAEDPKRVKVAQMTRHDHEAAGQREKKAEIIYPRRYWMKNMRTSQYAGIMVCLSED